VLGTLFRSWVFAHKISPSESRWGLLLEESCATCSHVKILYSQRGMSFWRIRLTRVYGWMGVGHPSLYVVMGMYNMSVVDMGLPDQISGLLEG